MANWARANGVVLIIDEILLGFRIHPGGAHALFDIEPDLVTYGKILGGGLPIGVVAGGGDIMSVIDGGAWSFGDDSVPRSGRTFFAGTFNKNPLGMAVAKAVLERLVAEGPGLQKALNARTDSLARSLNGWFRDEEIPIEIANFGSLFRFNSARTSTPSTIVWSTTVFMCGRGARASSRPRMEKTTCLGSRSATRQAARAWHVGTASEGRDR